MSYYQMQLKNGGFPPETRTLRDVLTSCIEAPTHEKIRAACCILFGVRELVTPSQEIQDFCADMNGILQVERAWLDKAEG